MIELNIRQALESRLDAWAKSKQLCVEFQNQRFDPEPELYLRATILWAPAASNDICSGEEHSGVFQIDVLGLPGKGSAETEALAGELATLFPLDQILDLNGHKLMQRTPLRVRTAQTDTSRHVVPTDFEFFAYA